MPLTIAPSMPLDQLAERMSNDTVPAPVVAAMRALLVERAPAHGWETTDDVADADWLRLLTLADASALQVGDRVEGGTGEGHDTGRIESIDGDAAFVAWDSGVKTPAALAHLRRLKA